MPDESEKSVDKVYMPNVQSEVGSFFWFFFNNFSLRLNINLKLILFALHRFST